MGLEPPREEGLLQAGGGEKEDAEVAGDAKTRLGTIEDAAEAATGDAAVAESRASRVSSAKLDLLELGTTRVEEDSEEEIDEEMEPREAWWRRGETEIRHLGICDNSPTNPGPLPLAKSKFGLKPSITLGAKEYSPPGK